MLDSFFITGDLPPNIEKGHYQFSLVLLSFLVASFASYTALSLAQQVTSARSGRQKQLLHWGGAFAMGAGIWSMHFIGMLSYKMRMVVEYDPKLTFLSMLFAIAASYIALRIVAYNKKLTLTQILVGAILMGIGICGMHYTGMAAMQMDADLRYIPSIFLLSVIIAIAASGAALWIAFTLAQHESIYRYFYQIGAALVMGAAICGMHYTGMWAAIFIPYADCRYDPNQDFHKLAIAIAAITVVLLGLALAVGFYRKAQTEFQLMNSENRLRLMINSALDGVIGMDQKGNVTEWNKQAEAIFGWPNQDVLGKNLAEIIIPPEYRQAHNQGMARFLADGTGPILNQRIEVDALHRSGRYIPVELTVAPQKLHDHTYHFTAFVRDITARKSAEKDRALLAAIVESSEDAIISKTLDGFITSWNKGAEHLFGHTAEEAAGQHISLIIPPERLLEEQEIITRLRNGESTDHIETIRKRKNGEIIYVSLSVSPIRDGAGRIVGASTIARNITDRKQLEEDRKKYMKSLEDSNRELDDFAYIASHDLKEPLRGMHNFSRFLLEDYDSKLDAEGKNMLHTIANLTKRMDQLLSALLHYSRLGRTKLSVRETDLGKIVDDAINMYAIKIKETNTNVQVQEKFPVVVCDYVRIAEVFQNLIGNALKYNDSPDKKIEVGYTNDHPDLPNEIVYFVKDNGIGIDKKHQESVFKIFRRLHAQEDYGGGTGSGLTITKKIIAQHGGRIWVESEGKGKGSTFFFTIPSQPRR